MQNKEFATHLAPKQKIDVVEKTEEIILAKEKEELEVLREIIKNKEIELNAMRESYWRKYKIWEADTN